MVARTTDVTPGYGRNRGAEQGSAEWLVFLDADVVPAPDLLDRYFDPLPAQDTALLAGALSTSRSAAAPDRRPLRAARAA